MAHKSRAAGAWELTAFLTAAATVCAGLDWLSVLVGAAASLLLCLLPGRRIGRIPRLALLWLPVLLWVVARAAGALFPESGNGWYVPAVALALGWLLARQPGRAVLACSAILCYFVLAAVAVVLVFALPDVRLIHLTPRFSWQQALVAFASGCGAWLLRTATGERSPVGCSAISHLLLPLTAVVVCGVLSPQLARGKVIAFYALSCSISLFGVLERFEALMAACVFLGCTSTAALILRAGRVLLPCGEVSRDWLTAAACTAVIFCPSLPLPSMLFTSVIAILWVIVPYMAQSVVGLKKDEKN